MKNLFKILKSAFALNSISSIFDDDSHKIVSERGKKILSEIN